VVSVIPSKGAASVARTSKSGAVSIRPIKAGTLKIVMKAPAFKGWSALNLSKTYTVK
jgi:hypothetical protein